MPETLASSFPTHAVEAPNGLPAGHWPLPARLAFRATLIYFVLVWAPLTFYTVLGLGWWKEGMRSSP